MALSVGDMCILNLELEFDHVIDCRHIFFRTGLVYRKLLLKRMKGSEKV